MKTTLEKTEPATPSETEDCPPRHNTRCWAEIDLAALDHNFEVARRRSPGSAGVMAVVKANCYGHGVLPVVRLLRDRAAWFAVANLREAVEIEPEAGGVPIILFGPVLPEEREEVVRRGFVPMLSSLEEARAFAALADSDNPAQAHVKIDTGMGRMGIDEANAAQIVPQIAKMRALRITGIATHFPSADDDPDYTREQVDRFRALLNRLAEVFDERPIVHCQNSAGILDYEFPPFVTVTRPGLMLYGVSPSGGNQELLRPVVTWKSRVVLVREVPAGRTVSYGRTFTTPKPMRIATLSAGYADGYPRIVSNRGAAVLIAGRRCPLLGRVTMDLIMADVTDLPPDAVEPGREAVLLGRQGHEQITPDELAKMAETIEYEIFTSISARVPRVQIPSPPQPQPHQRTGDER